MRKKSMGTGSRGAALEFLRGGKTVPEGLVRRRMADVKRRVKARFEEKNALQRQAAQYWSRIQKPIGEDAEAARAVDGLRGIDERLAKRKLIVPAAPREVAGILAGSYSVRVTPPYDYAFAGSSFVFPPVGNPDSAASADKNSGQLSCSIATDHANPSYGSPYAEMGIYFHPLFGPAILRVWANPAFAFSWWANSISAASPAGSFGHGWLEIWILQAGGSGPLYWRFQDFASWDVYAKQELEFDFGSNPGSAVFGQLQVDPSYVYGLSVSCECEATGSGWPGSLAGANLSITVPSITFEVDLMPVVEVQA